MPQTVIRPRTDDDLPACVRALAEVHRHDGYPVNWPADPARWLSPPSLTAARVAVRAGTPVAHITLCPPGPGDLAPALWAAATGTPPDRTAVVSRLFTAPRSRGLGLAARLLTEATALSRTLGRHPVLDVVSTDRTAAALYERLGWHRLAATEQSWSPGRTVTVVSYAAPRP
ncbi:GNAT family N-acetyltransferase [Streptomyces sp. NPDC003691]